MTWWILEKSVGFTDVGLLKISESVRAYAYLILSSQASARSSVVGNSASALTAQSAFLNNFENVVNRRVNIQEDIKRYQDTLSYASSKVDYSVGENLFMLPSDMKLKIKTGTVRCNNKILISDCNVSLGKNNEVNASLAKSEEETMTKQMTTIHKVVTKAPQPPAPAEKAIITHEDEKIAFILLLAGGFMVWYMFQSTEKFVYHRYTRSHAIPDIVYVPINWSLQFYAACCTKSHPTYYSLCSY